MKKSAHAAAESRWRGERRGQPSGRDRPSGVASGKTGEGNMEKKSVLEKVSLIAAAVVGCAFVAFLIFMFAANGIEIFASRPNEGYRTVEDYTRTDIETETAPAGVVTEYCFSIADTVKSDEHLAFYTTHQYTEVTIGGETVYRLTAAEDSVAKTAGSNWVMIPLSAGDAGKEVIVRITPVYRDFISRKTEFLLGSDLAIYAARLTRDLPELILSMLAIFIGTVFVVIGIWTLIRRKEGAPLSLLGMFSIMVGLWRLTDTRFTPFLFPERPVFVFYFSIAMLMLGTVPLMRSLRHRYNTVSKRILDVCSICVLGVSLVQLLLQITGVMDIREDLFLTHIMVVIGAMVILTNSIYYQWKNRGDDGKRTIGFLPFVCVAGGIADVAAFYIKGNSSGLFFTLAAFVLYTIISGIRMLLDYGERGRRIAEQEKELLKSRISIMLSQIKPHFLYNSLSSISELCMVDPAQARDALTDFSTYLRNNMDFIDTKECVHFSNELRHIETYLKLEKMRFGDRLHIVYDIQEDNFFLPPLTVQPLVENAVKHGICAKPEGGTITLATRRQGEQIVITVSDDGAGFDEREADGKEERSHIGLANIKKRLELMVGAHLTVQSEKGVGTVVTVILNPNTAGEREA